MNDLPVDDQPVFPGGGRRRSLDPDDQKFLLPRRAAAPTTKHYQYWASPPAMDQGRSSTCVGHACHQLLRCSPIRNVKNIPDPYTIYKQAQLIDEWPGQEPSYFGTSVRAGVKVLQKAGYISSYFWAFDGATAANHVLNVSPVILGVNWYSGMMRPNRHGYLELSGQIEGGHSVDWVGLNMTASNPDGTAGHVTILNSWGLDWANKGRAKITLKDMDRLIREDGEACAIFEQYKPVAVS